MPLYLQMGIQDQSPHSNVADKTKDDGSTKPSLPSTATAAGISSERMPPFHPRTAQCNTSNMSPLKMTKLQDKCISDAMAEIRVKHVKCAAKRQKLLEWHSQDDAFQDDAFMDCGSECQSLVDKLDAFPDFAQVVATPGGLITYRNESFCKLTKQLASLRKIPLTLFELIDPGYLPQFFGMLALALHNVTTFDSVHLISNKRDTRDENVVVSKTSHLSITLPCNKLLQSTSASSYNITVVYMNDFSSVKKCFLGIISQGKDDGNVPSALARSNSVVSSSSSSIGSAANNKCSGAKAALPCGKILQIDDDLLFALIKKA